MIKLLILIDNHDTHENSKNVTKIVIIYKFINFLHISFKYIYIYNNLIKNLKYYIIGKQGKKL